MSVLSRNCVLLAFLCYCPEICLAPQMTHAAYHSVFFLFWMSTVFSYMVFLCFVCLVCVAFQASLSPDDLSLSLSFDTWPPIYNHVQFPKCLSFISPELLYLILFDNILFNLQLFMLATLEYQCNLKRNNICETCKKMFSNIFSLSLSHFSFHWPKKTSRRKFWVGSKLHITMCSKAN